MAKEKIVQAALNRFARQGYTEASLAEIAEDAGIRKPSIYAHFKSKKSLYLYILDAAFQKEAEYIKRLSSPDALFALKNYINVIGCRYGEDAWLLFWLRAMYLPSAELSREVQEYDLRYVSLLDEAINSAICKINMPVEKMKRAELFGEAYTGIIRAIHAELLYHGPERANAKAIAMWEVFEAAILSPK